MKTQLTPFLLIIVSILTISCVEYVEKPFTKTSANLINSLRGDLRNNLVNGGLSPQQADTISDQAAQDAQGGGGNALVVQSAGVTPTRSTNRDITNILPRMTAGATKSLSRVSFTGEAQKKLAAGLIATSMIDFRTRGKITISSAQMETLTENIMTSSSKYLKHAAVDDESISSFIDHITREAGAAIIQRSQQSEQDRHLGKMNAGLTKGIYSMGIPADKKGDALSKALFASFSKVEEGLLTSPHKTQTIDRIVQDVIMAMGAIGADSSTAETMIKGAFSGGVSAIYNLDSFSGTIPKAKAAVKGINNAAVSAISKLGNHIDKSLFISAITGGSVSGMKDGNLDSNTVVETYKAITESVIEQLEHFPADHRGSIIESAIASSTTGIGLLSLSSAEIESNLESMATSALNSLEALGLEDSNALQHLSAKSVGGIVEGLLRSNLTSEDKVKLLEKTCQKSIASLGLLSLNESEEEALISMVVSEAIQNAENGEISAEQLTNTYTAITSGSTKALADMQRIDASELVDMVVDINSAATLALQYGNLDDADKISALKGVNKGSIREMGSAGVPSSSIVDAAKNIISKSAEKLDSISFNNTSVSNASKALTFVAVETLIGMDSNGTSINTIIDSVSDGVMTGTRTFIDNNPNVVAETLAGTVAGTIGQIIQYDVLTNAEKKLIIGNRIINILSDTSEIDPNGGSSISSFVNQVASTISATIPEVAPDEATMMELLETVGSAVTTGIENLNLSGNERSEALKEASSGIFSGVKESSITDASKIDIMKRVPSAMVNTIGDLAIDANQTAARIQDIVHGSIKSISNFSFDTNEVDEAIKSINESTSKALSQMDNFDASETTVLIKAISSGGIEGIKSAHLDSNQTISAVKKLTQGIISGINEFPASEKEHVIEAAMEDAISNVATLVLSPSDILRATENLSTGAMTAIADMNDLDLTTIKNYASKIAGASISGLGNSGLSDNEKIASINSTCQGVVKAVEHLGTISENEGNAVIAEIVKNSIKQVEAASISGAELTNAFSAVTSGATNAISDLSKVDSTEAGALATLIAETSTSSLQDTTLSEAEKIKALEGINHGIIGELENSGIEKNQVVSIIQDVVSASVSKIKDVGLLSLPLNKATEAVTAGAVSSLSGLEVSQSTSQLNSMVSSVSAGAMKGLVGNTFTNTEKVTAIQGVSQGCTKEIDTLGLESIEDKLEIVSGIIRKQVTDMESISLNSSEYQQAFENATSGATLALGEVNDIDHGHIRDLTKKVANTAVSSLADTTLNGSDLTNAITGITGGTIENMDNTGLTSNEIAETVKDVVEQVVLNIGILKTPKSIADVGSIVTDINSTATTATSQIGLSEAEQTELNSELTTISTDTQVVISNTTPPTVLDNSISGSDIPGLSVYEQTSTHLNFSNNVASDEHGIVGITVAKGPNFGEVTCSLDSLICTYVNTTFNSSDDFQIKILDAAGNLSDVITVQIPIIQAEGVLVEITSPQSGRYISSANENSFSIAGVCSAIGQNVVISGATSKTISCIDTGESIGSWSTTLNLAATGDGVVTLHVDHQNASATAYQRTTIHLNKDTTAPTVHNFHTTTTSPSSSRTLNISATTGAFGSNYHSYCLLENSSDILNCLWKDSPLPGSYEVSAINNSKVLTLWLKDGAHNVSAPLQSNAVVYDNIPPSITGLANNTTPTRSQNWSWGCNETYTYRYIINNNASTSPAGLYSGAHSAGQHTGSSTYYLHVQAKDQAGNESTVAHVSAILDNTAPPVLDMLIATGATYTQSLSVSLTLTGGGNAPNQMFISNTPDCSVGIWEAFNASKAWTLGHSNTTTSVYAKYRDLAGNETNCLLGDTIVHDDIAPVIIGLHNDSTPTRSKNWSWDCNESCTYRKIVNTSASTIPTSSWEGTSSASQASGSDTYYLHVLAKDQAGNISDATHVFALIDASEPPAATMAIAGGATYTKSSNVTLNLAASGETPAQMLISNTSNCSTGSWEAFNATKVWSLEQTNDTASVYAKYKDALGNETGCSLADTIIHDNIAPTILGLTNDTSAKRAKNWSWDCNESCSYRQTISTNPSTLPFGAYSDIVSVGHSSGTNTYYLHVQAIDQAGNESEVTHVYAVIDNTPVQQASMTIAAGATYTQSTEINLSLSPGEETPHQMLISNSVDCSLGSWETFSSNKAWTLGHSNTIASVYAKFRDIAGNETGCVLGDTILHDDTPPSITGLSNDTTPTKSKNWSWGCNETCTYRYTVNTSAETSPIGNYNEATSTAQTSGANTYYLHIQAKDPAGNESAVTHVSAIIDNTAPSAAAMSIADNATYTRSASIILSLTPGANVPSQMFISNTANCSDGSWEPFSNSKTWFLEHLNTTASVFAKYRDAASNETSCTLGDTIIHDNTPPSISGLADDFAPKKSKSWSWGCNETCTYRYAVNNSAITSPSGSYSEAHSAGQHVGSNTYYLHVQARDQAGNESPVMHVSAALDNSAPTVANMSIDSDATYTRSSNVTLALTATGEMPHQMYIANTANCASGSWEAFNATKAWTLGHSNTTASVYAKYRDTLGNETGCSLADTIIHDNTPPSISGLANDSAPTKSKSWSWGCNESCTYRYIINTSAGTSPSGDYTGATSASQTVGTNTYFIHVQAKDQAGNESSIAHISAIIDNSAPPVADMSIASDATYTNSSNVTLTLEATTEAPHQMYISNAAGCTSGAWEVFNATKVWTLEQSNTTALVYAKFRDSAGNESGCVLGDTIVHDNVPPSISGLADDGVAKKSKSWNWECNETCTYRSIINTSANTSPSGGYNSSTSAAQATGTSTYYIHVQAKDQAGNESSIVHVSAVIDNSAPNAVDMLINSDATYTQSSSATLSLEVVGESPHQMFISNAANCSSGSWEAFNATKAWTLGQSNTTASVYAKYRDVLGNETSCSLGDTIIHDNTPPSISGLANDTTPTKSKSWSWGCNETCTYRYTINASANTSPSGDYGGTTSAAQTTGTNTYYLHIQAKDQAGNETNVNHISAIIDNSAPSAATMSIAAGATYTRSTSVTLNLTAVGEAPHQMFISNTNSCTTGSWEAFNVSKAWTLGQSNNTASVYANFRDALGNETGCALADTIIHDNTQPSISGLANDTTSKKSKSWSWGCNETCTYRFIINTSANTSPSGSYGGTTSAAQTTGTNTYYLHVQAKDQAGNESSVIHISAVIDNSAPSVASMSIAAGATYTQSASVTLSLTAQGETPNQMLISNAANCSSGSWEAFNGSKAWTLGQSNTTASVYAKYKDSAGNETGCALGDTIIHDNTSPSISGLANDTTPKKSKSWSWGCNKTCSYRYTINTSAGTSLSSAYGSITSASQSTGTNTYYIHVQAKDQAGNESGVYHISAVIDNSAPPAANISIAAGATHTQSTSVTLSVTAQGETPNQMLISNAANCSSGSWEAFNGSKAWTLGQSNSTASVYAKYKDISGNETSCTLRDTIIHDNSAPSVIDLVNDTTPAKSKSWSWRCNETCTFRYTIDASPDTNPSGDYAAVSFANKSASGTGTYYIHVQAKDQAGNESAVTHVSVPIDNTAPTISGLSNDTTVARSKNWSWGCSETCTYRSSIDMSATTNPTGSYSATSSASHSIESGTFYLHVQAKDIAGNESGVVHVSTILDNIAPPAATMSINDGAANTDSTSVTLSLSAGGETPYQMLISNAADCGSGTWEAFSSSKAWTLGQTGATVQVYHKYKDSLGNETSCSLGDTIVHDSGPQGGANRYHISAGQSHALSVNPDGTVSGWGYNLYSQLGMCDYITATQTTPTAAFCDVSDIVLVSTGVKESYVIKTDKTAWTVGYGYNGNGNSARNWLPVQFQTNVKKIENNEDGAILLKYDGTVWTWGDIHMLGYVASEASYTATQIPGVSNAIDVSSGSSNQCYVLSDNTLWCWGKDYFGSLGDGDSNSATATTPIQILTSVRSISCGYRACLATKLDGTVWTWGSDSPQGRLGRGISAWQESSPVQISGLTDIIKASYGGNHGLALTSDGRVYSWGYNAYGQVGDGSTDMRSTPYLISSLSDILSVSAGSYFSLAQGNSGGI
ncbi:MAG: hypothetical protein ISR65_04745 [Bacteriovoracaceae bacterium]|nr:hypothetical protein [Bacteriovoracaceae bacterium]